MNLKEHSMTRLLALFFVSVALIAYELYVIRVFSIGSWYNFGSLIISTALLGVGLSGTLLTFLQKWIKKRPLTWLFALATLLLPTMALAHIFGQTIPFNPTFIGSDPGHIWWIALYYIIYGVPFFLAALFIGISFMTFSSEIYKLYFWNMIGSGVGGVFIILLMYLLPPAALIYPIMALIAIASLLAGVQIKAGPLDKYFYKRRDIYFLGGAFLATMILLFSWGGIRVSEYKSISSVQKFPDVMEVHHSYSPNGEYQVISSSALHFAPGLSDNAALELPTLPAQPFWGLFIDGNGPIGIMGQLGDNDRPFLDYLPMAAPYRVLAQPKVLMVGLGGGISAQVAKAKGAQEIHIVDQDSDLVELIARDPIIAPFTGNLLEDEKIEVVTGDPRAYSVEKEGAFDLVEISLVDSIGLSSSGGYPVVENFTYTKEAIQEYMGALNDEGILSITVWNRLNPPRNVPKLLTTIFKALEELELENPERHTIMFDFLNSTATILIKKTPFTNSEIHELRKFVDQLSFHTVYAPDVIYDEKDYVTPEEYQNAVTNAPEPVPMPEGSLQDIMNFYRSEFQDGVSFQKDYLSSDLYRFIIEAMVKGIDARRYLASEEGKAAKESFAGTEEEFRTQAMAGTDAILYTDYPFDIRPMEDQRPYYSGYLKLDQLGQYLSPDKIRAVSEDWGYLLILGVVIQSILFGLVVILVPVIGRWKALFSGRKGTAGVIIYFSSLGLGYMLVEIFLIQRLGEFLSNPTFSVSIVITSMLILSAVGNLVSGFLRKYRDYVVPLAAAGIVGMMIFYIFGLNGVLNAFRGASFGVRILVSLLVIAPSAFLMGIPFPNGLGELDSRRPSLLPWAWGMNGGLSVTGAALAKLVTVSAGFPFLLALAAFLYLLVGVFFPANKQANWIDIAQGKELPAPEPAES
jgi:spermidine synthase